MNWEKLIWVGIAAGLYIAAHEMGIENLEGLAGFVIGGAIIKSDGILKPDVVK